MFDPDMKTDNFGMHSPAKIYDTQRSQNKISKQHIKRENAQYSFGKAQRPIGVKINQKIDFLSSPGPSSYNI